MSGWVFALVAAAVGPAGWGASGSGWSDVGDQDDIRVWQRVRDDGLVEFRAEAFIERSVLDVFAVLYDHRQRHRWMVRTEEHRVVHQPSDREATLYTKVVVGFPFISDRDVVFGVQVDVLPDERRVRATFHAVEDLRVPPVQGLVRMPALDGQWTVDDAGPGRTRVRFAGYGDPGGWIPRWMVNVVARQMPRLFLQRVRELAMGDEFGESRQLLRDRFDWSWLEPDAE